MILGRSIRILGWFTLCLVICSLGAVAPALAGVNVLLRHNDLAQTGANTNETILTPANVSPSTFGKLFRHAVDGEIYAQPLVLTGVTIPGKGVHNVVYIATQHDSVYAFDADNADGPNSEALWHTSLINPDAGVTTFVPADIPGVDNAISPEIGITGTPVIDPDTGTLYVVAYTKEPGPVFVNRLHALDVTTGSEKTGSPVEIKASVIGFGSDSVNGEVAFNSKLQINRCGLTLARTAAHPGGLVCIAFTSHDGFGNYRGWLMGYDASNLTQAWAYCPTPNNLFASIWMSGAAPAVDSDGFIYVATANGPFSPDMDAYGDTVLKLADSGNTVTVADYFTPHNQQDLFINDLDLGSGGVMLLPDEVGSAALPHLMVAAGKFGTIFVLNRDTLGNYNAKDDSQIPLAVTNSLGTTGMSMWGAPAYFDGRVYYHPVTADVQAFGVANGVFTSNRIDNAIINSKSFPGPTPSISANGTTNGILWEMQVTGIGVQAPILRAYNATNLSSYLYDSGQAGARDVPGGKSVKFTVPTVANGRVFVGSGNSIDVYGLLGTRVPTPSLSPVGGAVPPGTQIQISDPLQSAQIRYTIDGSDPTISSPLYTAPITVTNPVTVIAKAFLSGLTESDATRGDYRLFVVGDGTGLLGSYYGQMSTPDIQGSPTLQKIDPAINFTWTDTGPDPSIGTSSFSVSWTGYVQAEYSETYTFYAAADDGVRLWVNGQPLVDAWVYEGLTTYSRAITLTAGEKYSIQMDYFQGGQSAAVALAWSSASTPLEYIPTSQLYPPNQPPSVSITSPAGNVGVASPASVKLTSRASDPDGTISQVTYYEDGAQIGTLSEAPYALTLTNLAVGSHVFYAEAFDDQGASGRSPFRIVNVSGADTNTPGPLTAPETFVPASLGTGLLGEYYVDDPNLEFIGAPAFTRLDSNIAFNWQGSTPNPSVDQWFYCVSWRGYLKAEQSETYTIYTATDDGVRLWLGGQLLVNEWFPQGLTTYSNTVTMVAGQLYPIQMDYFNYFNAGFAYLAWSSPSLPLDYIPQSQLYPPNRPPVVSLTSPSGNITNVWPGNLTLTASALDEDGSVSKVVFHENGVVMAEQTVAPYSLVLTNPPVGIHTYYAEAFDNMGGSSRSLEVVVTVTAPDTGPHGLVTRATVAPFLNLPGDLTSPWPGQLSGVGAFADTKSLVVSNALIPYTVIVPFWSDGAVKQRWFALPYDGAVPVDSKWQIQFSPSNDWEFPVGTVFVKHMELATNQMDTNSLRRLETRVLVNLGSSQVRAATYRWRSDYSDADLVTASQTEDIAVQTPSGVVTQQWFYPGPADCLTCHTIQSGGILGASKARQLNCLFQYDASGVTDNQLRALNNIAAFNPAVDETAITNYMQLANAQDATASIESRARSFLDVNCAYCHFPAGTGHGAFDARITTPLSVANLINGSVQGGIAGSRTIVPGDLDRSRIYQRINTVDPLAKMPPLARNLVDTEGAALLAQWIDSLAGAPPQLSVTNASGQPVLFWALGTNQWYLQESSGVGGNVNWSAGPTPSISGNQASVPLTATNETRFFRLNSVAPLP